MIKAKITMQEIRYKGTLVGIKITSIKKGTIPITADNEPLQLVSLKHPRAHTFFLTTTARNT